MLTADTEREFLEAAVARGLVTRDAVHDAQSRREPGRSLAQTLCAMGALDRARAAALLVEVRSLRVTRRTGAPRGPQALRGTPAPGARIGRYELREELGRGGMGVVWRAHDHQLGRDVALKMLSGLPDADAAERLIREAKAAARLRHPGIVSVHDAAIHDGIFVVALELVRGESLAKRLSKSGPFSFQQAATVVREVALAVAAAHGEGVVHRDLKPANILLDEDGHARLTDFGLARARGATSLTATGDILGTPAYMAPEQALGESSRIGPRTDIYGLCAVLFETLTGGPPFRGASSMALLRHVIEDEPPSPSKLRRERGLAAVPPDLETLCLVGLAKAPERRHPSATDLALELGRFLAGEPITTRRPGRIERLRRAARRRPVVAASFVLSLAGACAVVSSETAAARRAAAQERRERERALKVDGLLLLIAQAVTAEDFTLVAALASEIIAIDPTRPQAIFWRAAAESRSGDVLGALRDYDEVLRHGDQAPVLLERAHLRFRLGDFAGAEKDTDEAIRLAPRWAGPWTLRALCRSAAGDASGSVEDATRAIEREENQKAPTAGCWGVRAAARVLLREYDAAIADATEALRRDPGHAPAWNTRAVARLRLGNTREALEDANVAVALAPSDAGYRNTRALVRGDLGDVDGALADASECIRLQPDAAQGWGARATAHLARNELDAAIADATEAIRRDPDDPHTHNVRGEAEAKKGLRDAARADFRRVLELLLPGDDRVPRVRKALEELR